MTVAEQVERAKQQRAPHWHWIAGLGALAVVAFVVWRLAGSGGEPGPGPLMNSTRDNYSFPVPMGRPITWGVPVLYNEGDETAILQSVRPNRASPGLRVLKVLAAGENRGNHFIAGTREYPLDPPDRIRGLKPVRGFSVAPQRTKAGRQGVELVFVLQLDRPGRYVIDGIRARYLVGDTEHDETFVFRLAACTGPKQTYGGKCRLPGGP